MNKIHNLILLSILSIKSTYGQLNAKVDLEINNENLKTENFLDCDENEEQKRNILRSGCCFKPSNINYKSIITQNLTVSKNASITGNLTVGGKIITNTFDITKSLLVNNKSPVLGAVESLTDLRFTVMIPSSIGLSLVASSTSPYTITSSLSGSPTPTRIRGFGIGTISSLSVANPAINLSTAQFSLLYSEPDAGSVAVSGAAPTHAINTATALVVNLEFNITFSIPFSNTSTFYLPTTAITLENLGSPVFENTPGAFISNITPYITNLTNTGLTVNLAITAIGQEISQAENLSAIATAISNFIQNAYINFIIQGS